MERFNNYQFEVKSHDVPGHGEFENKWVKGYYYAIYENNKNTVIRESNEYFDSQIQCRYAAIGHITLLEKGEG